MTHSKPRNQWITDAEKILVDSSFAQIVERDCHSSEDSRPHRFYLFKSRDFSNIIPVTADGKVILIRQFRVGTSTHTLEIPGGLNDPEDHDAQAAAIREMTEETGYAPLPQAQCQRLLMPFANPAIMNNRCHAFVVGPVAKAAEQKLDPGEMIEVIEVPIADIPQMIREGAIDHALILLAFLSLAFLTPDGERGLIQQLQTFTKVPTPS